ncbi:LD-carboxypeptidase [Streptomyces noursei]
MSFQPAASYTIRLLAPSGYPHDPDAINRALERLSTAQHRIENIEATQRRFQRFGGTDGERAGDLNRLADPERPLPDIALAVRGGYGAAEHGVARSAYDVAIDMNGRRIVLPRITLHF